MFEHVHMAIEVWWATDKTRLVQFEADGRVSCSRKAGGSTRLRSSPGALMSVFASRRAKPVTNNNKTAINTPKKPKRRPLVAFSSPNSPIAVQRPF